MHHECHRRHRNPTPTCHDSQPGPEQLVHPANVSHGVHIHATASNDYALRHCPNGVLLIDDVVPSDWISAIPDQVESLAVRRQHGIDNIVWRRPTRHGRRRIRPVSTSTLDSYLSVSYSDVFAAGVPSPFRPCDETDALPRAIDGVAQLRTRRRGLLRRP